jgi:hypothetical protein
MASGMNHGASHGLSCLGQHGGGRRWTQLLRPVTTRFGQGFSFEHHLFGNLSHGHASVFPFASWPTPTMLLLVPGGATRATAMR